MEENEDMEDLREKSSEFILFFLPSPIFHPSQITLTTHYLNLDIIDNHITNKDEEVKD